MHTGERKTAGGRVGESGRHRARAPAWCALGLEIGRLKTGTPPRLRPPFHRLCRFRASTGRSAARRRSRISTNIKPTGRRRCTQVHCWIGATNPQIHEIIRQNLHRAPMYSGQIQSTGPRYCPSIEDKVVRFADKDHHQIFLEPEGLDTDEIYCNGISTSLPADVQEQIVRLIPGLANAQILRCGYAVEYDMVWPTQIQSTLETKKSGGTVPGRADQWHQRLRGGGRTGNRRGDQRGAICRWTRRRISCCGAIRRISAC